MDSSTAYAPVLSYLAARPGAPEFMLVDVGCGGGIDPMWWRFGPRFRALAIDPNTEEINRLRREECRPGIEYLAAFAALPAAHPFARRKAGGSDAGRSPWSRLAVARSIERGSARSAAPMPGAHETTTAPGSSSTPPPPSIDVPEYLSRLGIVSVDFVKIDVDGKDLEVLHSFATVLDSLQVLGLLVEVNFHGSACETDHTLHNTDRLLKQQGFELFDLTMRRYSMAALPGPYLYGFPAESHYGRLLQGDALYVRDLASTEHDDFAARLAPGKLLNLVSIFAAFGLPDCAAEVVLRFEEILAAGDDTPQVLDLLAAQAQGAFRRRPLTYREYMARFEAGDAMFFPTAGRVRRAVGGAVKGAVRTWWRFRTLVERERARHEAS
jgi:hypothetical protein